MFRERASCVCVRDQQIVLVKLRDPKTKRVRLFPPGGAVESNEKPDETALRELTEETGQTAELLSVPPRVIDYPFDWDGKKYHCRTHFYLAQWRGSSPADAISESIIVGFEWVPIALVSQQLSFDRNIETAVLELLERGKQCLQN